MTRPRVRHALKGLGPGGAERLVVAQASRHAATDDVVYLLPGKRHLVPLLDAAGVAHECLRAPSTARIGWLWRLRRGLIDRPVDIVHAHSPVVAAAARLLVHTVPRRIRPVVVSTEHNRWPRHHRLTLSLIHI